MPNKVTAYCRVVISKKLEKLIQQGSPVSILLGPVEGNKTVAQIILEVQDGVAGEQIAAMGETSLILNSFEIQDSIRTLVEDEENNGAVSSIFTQNSEPEAEVMAENDSRHPFHTEENDGKMAQVLPGDKTGLLVLQDRKMLQPKPGLARIVATSPDLPVSVEAQRMIKTAQSHPVNTKPHPHNPGQTIESKPATSHLMTWDRLMGLVNAIPGVDDYEDPRNTNKFVSRKEALDFENKLSHAPKLPMSVFIQNKTGGFLIVNDTGTKLRPNEVADLSRSSAAAIKNSRDLPWLFKGNKLAFVDESLYVDWLEGRLNPPADPMDVSGGETYSSIDEALAAMPGKFKDLDTASKASFKNKANREPGWGDNSDFGNMDITMEGEANNGSGYHVPESELAGVIASMSESRSDDEPSQRPREEGRKINPDKNRAVNRSSITYNR